MTAQMFLPHAEKDATIGGIARINSSVLKLFGKQVLRPVFLFFTIKEVL